MGRHRFPLLPISLLLASCSVDWGTPTWDGGTGEDGVTVSTELFQATDVENERRFFTNDIENSLPCGKSFWYPAGDVQEPFENWSLIMTKDGGEAYAGYGMILCHRSDGEYESMLTVMLRCDGYFQVAEVVGTDYRPFDDWQENDAIIEGYGRENDVYVGRSPDGIFHLWVNGIEIYQFIDNEEPFHGGGTQGFLAVVSPLEDFPDFPVAVRFRTR